MKLSAILQIVRPANVITAITDVLAGVAIAGYFVFNTLTMLNIILLSIATAGLYAGGIVFNDIFDIEHDKKHRPERVIPSGKLSIKNATNLGILLFIIAICSAFLVSKSSGFIAIAIMSSALLYDKYGKHNIIIGPLNMGL